MTGYLVAMVTGMVISAALGVVIGHGAYARYSAARVLLHEARVQGIIDNVVTRTSANRALVSRMHNGGGRIQAGVSKYTSVLKEAHDNNERAILADFQGQRLDAHYISVLAGLATTDYLLLRTTELPGGMLYRRAEAGNISEMIMYAIAETPNSMYYVSFTARAGQSLTEATTITAIEVAANALRNEFGRAKKERFLH